jgi:hypothetical protein
MIGQQTASLVHGGRKTKRGEKNSRYPFHVRTSGIPKQISILSPPSPAAKIALKHSFLTQPTKAEFHYTLKIIRYSVGLSILPPRPLFLFLSGYPPPHYDYTFLYTQSYHSPPTPLNASLPVWLDLSSSTSQELPTVSMLAAAFTIKSDHRVHIKQRLKVFRSLVS